MAIPTPVSPVVPMDCHAQALIDAKRDHPHKKKIFVFCDGTGNEFQQKGDGCDGNSNVVKLYTTLRVADDQIAYYHPGVGTMGNPAIQNRVVRAWSKVKGLAFGAGFRDHVLDAYQYLMEQYNDGDEIYLFGFSRGAYTARALAAMLHGYGLLCRGNEGHILYAWKMFVDEVEKTRDKQKQDKKDGKKTAHRIQRNYAFSETFSRQVTIRFLGVWDTVSSVGWIFTPLRLLDMAQNPIVQVGRHAVSIDERRAFYRDNLWDKDPVSFDDPEWPEEFRREGIRQDIAQVWFPGMHSDVGGSYPQREAAPANEALAWMIGELQKHGAQLCEDRIDLVLGKPTGYTDDRAAIFQKPKPDHCLHESLKGSWRLLQLFPQQYYSKEDDEILWRVPFGTPRSIPDESVIHGSAVRRMDATTPGEETYRPRNLKRDELHLIQGGLADSTADVSGCYKVRYKERHPTGKKDGTRLAKLAVGWVTFVAFWAAIVGVVWYVLGLAVLLAKGVLWLVAHTPGLRRIA